VRRFLRFLLRLFFAFAWLLVLGAAGLIALEESGVLTRVVQQRLARELGALGPHVHLERARLLWFEPGLVLDGLTFDGERGPDGVWRAGPERLRLSSIHVRLDPRLDPRKPVREIEIKGGRLLLAGALFDAVQELADQAGPEPGGGAPPPITLRGLALEVERIPGSGEPRATAPERVPLGSVDLALRPDGSGEQGRGARITGELRASLGGAVQTPNTIVVEGALAPEGGATLRAIARGITLNSAGLDEADVARIAELERFQGELDLDLVLDLPPSPAGPTASLALRIEDGRVERAGELPLTDLVVGADVRCTPGAGGGLASPDAWAATMRASGRYDDASIDATVLFGGDAGERSLVEAFGRASDLHLRESSLRAFHVDHIFDVVETYRALEPEGTVDAAFSARVAREPRPAADTAPGPRRPVEVAVEIRADGEAAMTFRGWKNDRGERQGVPLRCAEVAGDMLLAVDTRAEQPARFALLDLVGDHGTGNVHASGLIASAPGGKHSDLDLRFRVPSIAIDDRLGAALHSLSGVGETWDSLAPSAGTLSSEWRLRSRRALGGLTALGRVELKDATLSWREIPVPLSQLDGRIDLRWSRRASVVTDEPVTVYGEQPLHRPIGVLWSVAAREGTTQPTGLVVRSRGLLRESPLEPRVTRAEIPRTAADSLEIELVDLLLRGRDWDALAARFPEAGREVSDLRAQGRVDLTYRGRRPTATAPYRYDIEISARPGEVVVTPTVFRRQTQDVVGRVLLHGDVESAAGDATRNPLEAGESDESGESGEDVRSEGRFHLFGAWGRDVVLASGGTFSAGSGGEVVVRGAGVDPASPTLRGALASSLSAEGGREVDLSAIEIDGRLDFEARVTVPPAPAGREAGGLGAPDGPPPESAYRVFLRDNRFRSENFTLDALAGVLLQERDALSSPSLRASIAGTPIEMTDVLLLPLSTAAAHPRADAQLARPGYADLGDGFAFQADFAAANVALDRAHLSTLLDEETVALLLERNDLSGAIDVAGGHVLAASPRNGVGKVALRGRVTPRPVTLAAGLPLTLLRGAIDVQELVLEAGRLRGWWRVEDLDGEVAGRALSDAAMTMTFVDGRLTIDNLRGLFAGGEIRSLGGGEQSDRAIAVDLSEPYAYSLAMRLDDVAVEEVLGAIFSAGANDLGALSARMRLRGRGADVLALSGSGSIQLADARLWSIPVVRELFRSLGADSTAVFDEMELDWALDDGTVALHDIRVKSPILRLVGDGAVELTGEVWTDLQVRYGLVDRIGPLNRIVYWLNNSLFRVAVRGDMLRPVVFVRNSLLELVFGFDEDVPRSLPLPSWRPLPRMF